MPSLRPMRPCPCPPLHPTHLQIPPVLPEAAVAAAAQACPSALPILRQLLQQRPVWPTAALHEAVAAAGYPVGTGGSIGVVGGTKSPYDDLLPK